MNGFDESYQPQDPNDLKNLLKIRAVELFKQCDQEDKGFINKRDIQRMKEPLGLSAELLEEVFESLDYDGNGYLTLDEFTAGFSSYLGSSFDDGDEKHFHNQRDEIKEEEDILFRETMESLGVTNLVDG
jgi:Ras and EF-hand domain-containing protein